MYKLLAIDMDGTLLKDDKTITNWTKESLKKAIALEVKIVLTSGRPIQGLKNYLDELELTGEEDYVIGLNVIYAGSFGSRMSLLSKTN